MPSVAGRERSHHVRPPSARFAARRGGLGPSSVQPRVPPGRPDGEEESSVARGAMAKYPPPRRRPHAHVVSAEGGADRRQRRRFRGRRSRVLAPRPSRGSPADGSPKRSGIGDTIYAAGRKSLPSARHEAGSSTERPSDTSVRGPRSTDRRLDLVGRRSRRTGHGRVQRRTLRRGRAGLARAFSCRRFAVQEPLAVLVDARQSPWHQIPGTVAVPSGSAGIAAGAGMRHGFATRLADLARVGTVPSGRNTAPPSPGRAPARTQNVRAD